MDKFQIFTKDAYHFEDHIWFVHLVQQDYHYYASNPSHSSNTMHQWQWLLTGFVGWILCIKAQDFMQGGYYWQTYWYSWIVFCPWLLWCALGILTTFRLNTMPHSTGILFETRDLNSIAFGHRHKKNHLDLHVNLNLQLKFEIWNHIFVFGILNPGNISEKKQTTAGIELKS